MRRTLLITLLAALSASAAAVPASERRTLAVTGTAEVSVAPDICYMSFAVESRERSAVQAYKANNEQVNTMTAAIKAAGIDARDLQTVRFSITPEYHYEKNTTKRVFDGYHVMNTLYVKIRDLTKVSEVLDAGVNSGASEVSEVRFAVENPKKYTAGARADAYKAARDKAETIAALTGVKLVKPITISEAEPGGRGMYAQTANVMADYEASGGSSGVSLEPGEVKITHTVYITYEVE